MKEEWKELREFKGYFISNLGRIKGINGKIRIPYKGRFIKFENQKTSKSIANLVYDTFVKPLANRTSVYHLDGNQLNFRPENLISTADRDKMIADEFKENRNINAICKKYNLSTRTARNILERQLVPYSQRPVILPKHSAKGKMEYQNYSGENKIPYADNCTVRPKSYDSNAYLIRQFTYNY